MISIFDPLRDITFLSTAVRLLMAYICGLVIGMERSFKNRSAGMRTHILVCIGAAIASMAGEFMYLNLKLPVDISRIGSQVVSGLGFIGAGTIVVTHARSVKGLTTAAGLWATGIAGLAIGAGFYEGGLYATILILITETLFFSFSKNIRRSPEFDIVVHYHQKASLDEVMRYCKDHRLSIANLRVKGESDGENAAYTAHITLRQRTNTNRDLLLSHIRGVDGVISAEEA